MRAPPALVGDQAAFTAAQVYTAHDIHPQLASHFAAEALTGIVLTWRIAVAPVEELEFEMELRRVANGRVF